MSTTLTSKGQVTIPQRIRDALHLLPGAAVAFSVNASGEVVLHPPRPAKGTRGARKRSGPVCLNSFPRFILNPAVTRWPAAGSEALVGQWPVRFCC